MTNDAQTMDGWSEWRHYTLAELTRLSDAIEKLEAHNSETDVWVAVEIAKLKLLAAIWGTIAGIVTSAAVLVITKVVFG